MLNKKTFVMSMFASKADLYKAKAEYYESQAEKLQMEVVVLEAKVNAAADLTDKLTETLQLV